MKQLMAGGGVALIGTTLVPVSYTHLAVYKRQHDEFTMKPTLDENGRLMLSEDYRIATLN